MTLPKISAIQCQTLKLINMATKTYNKPLAHAIQIMKI
jgi:hypothetical protein